MKWSLARALPRAMLVTRGPVSSASACLTFDDGPDPDLTPRLLDLLAKEGVKASFFVIGQSAERHPEIIRRIQAEGHALGHHSYSHPDPYLVSAREMRREIHRSSDVMARILGHRVRLYRPPRGKLRALDLLWVWARQQTVVLWNVDPVDFCLASSERILQWFDARPLRGGDLVLLHDRCPHTIAAMPGIIERARRSGLQLESIEPWLRWLSGPRP